MGSWGREDSQQGGCWRTGVGKVVDGGPGCLQINWEEQLGSETD